MKKALALLIAAGSLFTSGNALALDCNTVIALINRGASQEQIAQAAGVPISVVDSCQRRQTGAFRLNPAGPPPSNPAGSFSGNPAGSFSGNPAGSFSGNPAGPGPRNPAGPPPLNPAGIPK